MDKNKAPNKGLNTDQNNGLTDTQEVLYAKDFTRAVKAENKYREENGNKGKQIHKKMALKPSFLFPYSIEKDSMFRQKCDGYWFYVGTITQFL